MRQKKTTEKETRHRRHHDSLHCSRGCNAILTERHSVKTKQATNWSVSSFKGKLIKFFRFKIVKYETRAFKRKIEIKPILILFISLTANIERTITSDIVVRYSRRILCTIPPAML